MPCRQPGSVVQELLRNYFLIYLGCNIAGAVIFLNWRRLPPGLFQWLAFTMGLLDGLFAAGLTLFTGGFDSITFWIFPGLILLNTLSIPLAIPQLMLNFILSLFYLASVLSSPHLGSNDTAITVVPGHSFPGLHATNQPPRQAEILRHKKPVWSEGTGESNPADEVSAESLLLRLSLLWLLTACCYGAQLLLERQRLAEEEAGEFAAREGQLRSAGRLAAEFAHQIKNPLAVINNAAFSLQRAARDGKAPAAEQVEIIQEEVARADKVITQIMGYAQLSEGHVEKLNVIQELDRALAQVFPTAVPSKIFIHREYGHGFPPLLMQRNHLSEVVVNLLQNAREALGCRGDVFVSAACHRDYSVEISVRDNGPGISPDKIERVLEAYYTTKEKGTGLGLAIVKHNTELYGGTLRVESELGKGAKFTVIFPAKALIRFSK